MLKVQIESKNEVFLISSIKENPSFIFLTFYGKKEKTNQGKEKKENIKTENNFIISLKLLRPSKNRKEKKINANSRY